MKAFFSISVLICTFSMQTIAQIINIPDVNFKNYLIANAQINLNQDNEIDSLEAATFGGTIDVPALGIQSLEGVQYFTALKKLICHSNLIDSIDLSNSQNLTYLDCHNNQIVDLNIQQNSQLDTLSCAYNNLAVLDLSGNSLIKVLACQNNSLSNISTSNMDSLAVLFCNNNQLQELDLSGNGYLIQLNCDNNSLDSLSLLNNHKLKFLECKNNQLVSLVLDCPFSLQVLWCHINALQQLDISAYINLQNIKCNNNQLQDLNLNLCSKLKMLDCSNNQIDSLLFTPTAELETLNCTNNNMQFLELIHCSKLKELTCSDNAYTSLDLSFNALLEKLTIKSVHPLLALDLSNNSALDYLDIQGDFFFNPTQLNSLNVKNGNNQNMSYFNSTMNYNLTCIEVDDANYSNNNWTSKDPSAFFSEDCTITNSTRFEALSPRIYPNPAKDHLLVEYPDLGNRVYCIYSHDGRLIQKGSSDKGLIHLDQLSSGMYVLRIPDLICEKFVKE